MTWSASASGCAHMTADACRRYAACVTVGIEQRRHREFTSGSTSLPGKACCARHGTDTELPSRCQESSCAAQTQPLLLPRLRGCRQIDAPRSPDTVFVTPAHRGTDTNGARLHTPTVPTKPTAPARVVGCRRCAKPSWRRRSRLATGGHRQSINFPTVRPHSFTSRPRQRAEALAGSV